jgi:hypothetical protein
MKNPFLGMEEGINDASTAAQLLATLFEMEDERVARSDRPGPMVIHEHEADLIRFMIYDLCKRTNEVKKTFYALADDETAAREHLERKAA